MRPKSTTTAEIPECTARRHGTRNARYEHGCCCPTGKLEAFRYDKASRHGQLPAYLIDATGTRRRLQAYALNGWTVEQIGNAIGCARNHVVKLCRAPQVTVERAQAVRAAEWMATTRPPASRSATYARKHAAKAGWWPLDAWFDIDRDPEPTSADEITLMHAVAGDFRWGQLTEQDRRAAVQTLVGRGLSDTLVADRLNTNSATVGRLRQRLGLPPNPHERRRA